MTHAQNVANPENAKVVNTTGHSTQNNADNQSFETRTRAHLIPNVNVNNNRTKSASAHSSAMSGVNLAPSVNSDNSVFNNSNVQSKGDHVNSAVNSMAQSLSYNTSGIGVVDNFNTALFKNASNASDIFKGQKSSQNVTNSAASKKTFNNDFNQSIKNSVASSKSAHS